MIQASNNINFYRPSIRIVLSALDGEAMPVEADNRNATPVVLERDIRITVKSFSFPNNPFFRLQDIKLSIPQGAKIAIVGPSGSGKSTLMDILLGLFPDFDGDIVVDGVSRGEDISAWQRSVGYIPQNVYLIDDTITRNIAFGVREQDIDLQAVKRAVSLAGLQPVVDSQPSGVETVIGDRGIRISGGERQRIGIARALYHDPSVLVLDEATSALDNQTERDVVDSLLSLSPAKTIIIIAHRLSSVRLCDRVYLMSSGRIVDAGTFEDIAGRHPDFVNPQSSLQASAN